MKRLIEIQNTLVARKDQKATDTRAFNYRTAEDILAKVKPLCLEKRLAIVLNDDLVYIGDRYFIKSTVHLICEDGKQLAEASSFAELDDHIVIKATGEKKKGMSLEQCTGSASSYARKYALCALFAIDNSEQDPDSMPLDNYTADVAKEEIKEAKDKETLEAVWAKSKNLKEAAAISALIKARLLELQKPEVPAKMPSMSITGKPEEKQ